MGSVVSRLNYGIASTPAKPMPPVAEYEAWLERRVGESVRPGNTTQISASIYRRVAQLRRLHDTWSEIGRCVGHGAGEVKNIWLRLPEELR